MRLLRTILAVLVALSLTALPFGAPAMASPSATPATAVDTHGHAGMAVHGAMHQAAQMAMDESCHHHGDSTAPSKQDRNQDQHKGCRFAPCCVGVTVAVAPMVSAQFTALIFKEGRFPARIDRFVPDHAGTPPFRPPRA